MKNRGFTLIELMGVIIILSLLVMISVPVVDKYVKKTREEAATSQMDSLILAAKNWASDNREGLPVDGGKIKVSFYTLSELGYLDLNINLSNFKVDGRELAMYDSIEITNQGGKYKYALYEDTTVDNTAPINLSMKLVESTINTLTVKAYAEDPETPIANYEFNIDNNRDADGGVKWEGGNGARVYTFKNLSEGQHTVMFRVTNSKGLQTESKKFKYNTKAIARLDFIVKNAPNNCTGGRTIRIIFPAGSINRQYKTDLGSTYIPVTSNTVDYVTTYNGQPITAQADLEGTTIMSTYTATYTTVDKNGKVTNCPK